MWKRSVTITRKYPKTHSSVENRLTNQDYVTTNGVAEG
jgi:hypothetical protein